MNRVQLQQMKTARGFLAALDQSGDSTPRALKDYGIGENEYLDDDEMFALMHAMRSRIITSPSFSRTHVINGIATARPPPQED